MSIMFREVVGPAGDGKVTNLRASLARAGTPLLHANCSFSPLPEVLFTIAAAARHSRALVLDGLCDMKPEHIERVKEALDDVGGRADVHVEVYITGTKSVMYTR